MSYLNVVYNKKIRPYTNYPKQLTKYIKKNLQIPDNATILDVGCGRGEFSSGFVSQNLNVFAIDKEIDIEGYVGPKNIKAVDIENSNLPFEDNSFDYVFSKSVIEHLYHPEKLFSEIYRVLKPGGTVITMCPAWEYNYKIFYEDFTHRTPFMRISLEDFLLISDFKEVRVDYFIQLPSTWTGSLRSVSRLLVILTRLFAPNFLKPNFKWIRFSKEVMLFSTAKK